VSEPNFDLVILGGGSGGYAAALRGAQLGLSVALVEKGKLGGTCLHRGCIPTKALLHAAEVADLARGSAAVGVRTRFDGIDMPAVIHYRDAVVSRLYKGLQGLVKSSDVHLIRGEGRLVGARTVEVAGARYEARRAVVLATGSHARTLPGLEIGGRVITSDQALDLDHVPGTVIVLGGGVIGVEFASLWRSFGADVTVVEALPRLLAAEDEASSKALERAFRKRGINVLVGSPFAGVAPSDSGVAVSLGTGERLEADLLLVAVGRGPNTAGMGFEEAGIGLDQGFVTTDDRLRTTLPGVYAVGDVVRGPQLAHRGFQQGIFVAEEVAGLSPQPINDAGIPRIAYCDPEVASVGYTQAQADERLGPDRVEVYQYDLGGNAKSRILGTAGFVKVVREKDGPVVGVHMVGARVGELIGEGQLAVNWEAYPEDIAWLVHAHPTQGEAFGEAFLALAGKPLHAHA
jgi:dihydrolipoamide dehydrogenase